MQLNTLTLIQAKKGLFNKDFSSVELTTACLDQIKLHDKDVNAFITITEKHALEQAKKADQQLNNATMQQLEAFPLLGIPLALKDLYSTKGIPTTAASKVLEDYIPPYDATVVTKLKNAGAVILGKTNLDAWAHGSSGENSDFGPTKNPYNKAYVPGGSSSGSAAALAADMCIASTGTDTGGSIRIPASFCNVVGLKPTYGRVSRSGIIAMASSLDSIGHFTKTVEDSALFLQVTAGHDPLDATTMRHPELDSGSEVPKPDAAKALTGRQVRHDKEDFTQNLKKGVKGLKIGIPKEYVTSDLSNEVAKPFEEVQKVFEKLGAEVKEVTLPHTEHAIACYYIIQPSEVSSNLARYDGIRYGADRTAFNDEAKRRIMLGTYTLSAGYYDAYYKKAMQVRTLIMRDFDLAFSEVDAIIAPVSPTPPWKIGEKVNDPLSMYLSDVFTVTINMAGIPGLAVPIGFANDLPIGMQILGPQFSESLLFQIGHAYEQATEWHLRKPEL